MRWLLAAVPILLGVGGFTLLALAPDTNSAEQAAADRNPAFASLLSTTVTCPGDIRWPAVLVNGPKGGEGSRSRANPNRVRAVSGTVTGMEANPSGLAIRIAGESGEEIEADLVNPACAPPFLSRWHPFIDAAWAAWTRPCEGCEWEDRIGTSVRLGLVEARAGTHRLSPIVALAFDGCPEAGDEGGKDSPAKEEAPGATSTAATWSPTPDGGGEEATPVADSPETATPDAEATAPCESTATPEASPATEVASPTSAVPTSAPPEPTATPAGPSGAVTLVSYTARVARGDDASATVSGPPGAVCEISYTTPAGSVSKASGLSPLTLGADGRGSWTWGVSSRTSPGTGSITVDCEGESVTAAIEIV